LIFKAIQSWLKSGDILLDDLFQTPFPKLSFQALQSPDMFDEAVEIICDIIYETREYHNFTQYIHELVTLLNSLLVNIKENLDNFDGDNWRGLNRIFVEAGETWLNLILMQSAEFFNIVEGIYLCFKHAELEWIGMSFSFWIKFARDLEQVPNHPFAPIFKNLVESIINHLQFPDDDHEFTAQERDDFKDFRHEIGDILKDACILLGPETTLNIPYTIINTRMQQGNLDSDLSAWKTLEAPLFSLRCIGSQIPPDHSSILPNILQLFPRLPNNPDLQYTCTLVIARYTQWTANHPELIQFQLDYIINGFDNPTVAPASALALKFLCQDCSDALGQYFGRILEVYEKATSLLNKKEILDISEGVAYMVNSLQPQERYAALVKLIDPISKKLTPEHFSTLETLAFDIKRINLFFDITAPDADTDIPHPSAQIISTITPGMELILEKLGDNYHVAEALGRFFVLLIRDYKQYTKEYIPTLLPRISAAFAKSSQPVYLWISERVITYHSEFSPSHCLNLIDSVSMGLFQKLEAVNFDPNQLPDLMEEYSYLVNAVLSKLSQQFLRSHIASNVYRLLFLTPKLKEYHSFQSCLSSWRVFSRMLCVSEPPLSASELSPYFQVIDQAGQSSLEDLVDGMIFDYSDESLHDALFVTIYLSELNPELHLNQMAKIIETLKGPNFLQSDRISFLQHYSEKIQNRNWREARSVLQKFLEQFHKRNFARNNNRN
jgi:transportin-3